MPKISKRTVDALKNGPTTLWDDDLKGFGVRATSRGFKTYVVAYRPHPGGRSTPKRWYTICLTAALLLGNVGTSWGADLQKGLAAAKSGDYATALREWKPLAKQGNASAQYNLGLMYYKGQGVLQDYKTAVKWYRLAAEQGNANAQSNLGLMYYKGQGVLQDYKTAVKWYRLAAEQGNANAQSNLGNPMKQTFSINSAPLPSPPPGAVVHVGGENN